MERLQIGVLRSRDTEKTSGTIRNTTRGLLVLCESIGGNQNESGT